MAKLKPDHFDHYFNEAVEGETITHVKFFPYKELVVKDRAEFYKKYCEDTVQLQNQDLGDGYPNLGFVYRGVVPLVIRITLRFEGEFQIVQCDEFLMGIVREAQKCIERMFETSPPKEENENHIAELMACLFEGSDVFYQNQTISKAKIYFPYCKSYFENFAERFYPMLQDKVRENNVLNLLDEEYREALKIGWNQIIDFDDFQSPLPLYLSVTDKISPPLEVTHIYPKLPDNLEDYDDANDISANVLFDPKHHQYYKGEENVELNRFYPILFDKDYNDVITALIPEHEMIPKTPMPANVKDEIKKGRAGRGRQLDIAKEMIEILKGEPDLLVEYADLIGRSINGSDRSDNSRETREGEDLFLDVCRINEGENFKLRKSKVQYKDLRNQTVSYTYKTLCYIVKLRLPKMFDNWHIKWVEEAISEAVKNPTEINRVAEIIYREFFMTFLVSSFSRDIWYNFDGNTWEQSDKSVDIRREIAEKILPKLEKHIFIKEKKKDEENHAGRKRDFQLDIDAVRQVIKKLSSSKGVGDSVQQLREMFYEKNFELNQNKNIYVTGVKGGVLEAKKDKMIFRPGFPEDYVTKKTDTFYEPHSMNHPHVKFIMTWFEQMWPKETAHFVLKFFASIFIGRNMDKIFLLLTGKGNNGKSQLIRLLEFTFGKDYHTDVTQEAFSRKKTNASGPTQEWEDARDTRVITVNEPDEDFFSSNVKKITGGDKFRSRGLNEKGGPMRSTFKPIIFSNQPPGLEGDEAMQSRARLIECRGRYLPADTVPQDVEEQKRLRRFPIDPDIEEKILKASNAFLWLLGEYYAIYRKEGLKIPPDMQKSANKYWKKYDYTKQFMEEYLSDKGVDGVQLTLDKTILVTDLYKIFTGWYTDMIPNKKVPDINNFRYLLAQKGIDMDEDESVCRGVRNKKLSNLGGLGLAGGLNGLGGGLGVNGGMMGIPDIPIHVGGK